MVPAGGVYTNVLDMARYLMFHINEGRVDGRPLLRDDLMQAMHTVAFPEPHETVRVRAGHRRRPLRAGGFLFPRRGRLRLRKLHGHVPGVEAGHHLYDEFGTGRPGHRLDDGHRQRLDRESGRSAGPEFEKPTVDTGRPLPPSDARIQRLAGEYSDDIIIGERDGVLGFTRGKEFYPLSFYEDGGEVVGVFGQILRASRQTAARRPPGTLVHLNRLSGTVSYYDFHKPEKSADPPGPGQAGMEALSRKLPGVDLGPGARVHGDDRRRQRISDLQRHALPGASAGALLPL